MAVKQYIGSYSLSGSSQYVTFDVLISPVDTTRAYLTGVSGGLVGISQAGDYFLSYKAELIGATIVRFTVFQSKALTWDGSAFSYAFFIVDDAAPAAADTARTR